MVAMVVMVVVLTLVLPNDAAALPLSRPVSQRISPAVGHLLLWCGTCLLPFPGKVRPAFVNSRSARSRDESIGATCRSAPGFQM